MSGVLGLGSPWTRALFPGPMRAEIEALIPDGYMVSVTAVNGKPGPWRVIGYLAAPDTPDQPIIELESRVTYSPQDAVRLMAVRLPMNAMRCTDCGHRLDDMGGCDSCAADLEALMTEGDDDAG